VRGIEKENRMTDHHKSLVDPLHAYDQIAKWERVWTEAVALAWKEWDKEGGFRGRLRADPRAAILQEFGFQLPKDVDLTVEEGTVEPVMKGDRSWAHPRALAHLKLTLPRPPKDANDQAIALSHYVASGQSMPFTCCC
jgi:ribosomally synthesized peptide (two-chain TOMM family)